MTYRFQRISDVGASHPVIARLVLQSFDLMEASSLSEKERQTVGSMLMDSLQPPLVECYQIREALVQDMMTALKSQRPDHDNRVVHFDEIIRLNQKAENFLYQAKNFLRETHKIWAFFDGSMLHEASAYVSWKDGKKSDWLTWAEKVYEAGDDRIAVIETNTVWLKRVIQMRNAVEHPGRNSGTLHIRNVWLDDQNRMVGPSWHLDAEDPVLMLSEMDTICDHLLGIAEDMIAMNIRPKLYPMMEIVEIPPENRDPEQPKRLALEMSPDFRAKLIAASKAKKDSGAV